MKLIIQKYVLLSRFSFALIAFFSTIAVNAQDINLKKDTAISILVKQKIHQPLPKIDEKIKKSEGFRTVCIASLKSESNPFYILDGKIIDEDKMKKLDPDSIERIEVLKDSSAAALLGSRGRSGVIIITSKKQMRPPKSKISK